MVRFLASFLFLVIAAGDACAQSRQPPEQSAAEGQIEQRGGNEQSAQDRSDAALAAPDDESAANEDGSEANERVPQSLIARITADPLMALLTFGLLVAAFFQVRISSDQAKATTAAAVSASAQAERAFKLTQRPALRVKQVEVTVTPDQPLVGRFLVVNEGATKAKILRHQCAVYWCDGRLPQRYVLQTVSRAQSAPEDASALDGRDTLAGGQAEFWTFLQGRTISSQDWANVNRTNEPWAFYLIGLFKYVDELGTEHRTLFCRKYDRKSGRYVAADDPDYEYQT